MKNFFALVLTCFGFAAQAQTAVPPFELERLVLNPAGKGGLLVGGADVLAPGELRLSLTAHYEHDPLVFRSFEGTRLGTVVGHRFTTHLAGAYGVTRWLELGVQLPIVLSQGSESGLGELGIASVQRSSLGTPWAQARFSLLRQEEGAPVDLALTGAFALPLGSATALARDEGLGFAPRLGLGHALGDTLRLSAELGAWLRPQQRLSPEGEDAVGSQLELGLGVSTLGEGLRFEGSVRSALSLTGAGAAIELMAGARYGTGPFEVYAIAGPGFGHHPGNPSFRALAGVALHTGKEKDKGTGKTPEPQKCVEGTPYALTDCPDLDQDGDGVKNGADGCPAVAGAADNRGCPPADGDGDGVPDAQDRCPTERGEAALGGCPDADGDGVADGDDLCPKEPGGMDARGCPDKDTDGDGVPDAQDACPQEAGDPKHQGCAPPAATPPAPTSQEDGDDVPRATDNCPRVAGPTDNQGCPNPPKQLLSIESERFNLKEQVRFDTGQTTIKPGSLPVLDQVAAVLQEHPELQGIEIGGHTDSSGRPEVNEKLSQARAEAVRTYLMNKGVDGKRLVARGYGSSKPLADNATPEGRERNRRVEFVIQGVETKRP